MHKGVCLMVHVSQAQENCEEGADIPVLVLPSRVRSNDETHIVDDVKIWQIK